MNGTSLVARFDWRGIAIEVSYQPQWLRAGWNNGSVAHLQIRSVLPERAPLPITETGYRSRFLSDSEVQLFCGPVAFAQAWLEIEARNAAWRARCEAADQLSLF